jgi:hypothetical protein
MKYAMVTATSGAKKRLKMATELKSIAATLAPTVAKRTNRKALSRFKKSGIFTGRAHSSDGHPLQVRQNGRFVLTQEWAWRSSGGRRKSLKSGLPHLGELVGGPPGGRRLDVVSTAKILFQPNVKTDKQITAAHFLYFELGLAGVPVAPGDRNNRP